MGRGGERANEWTTWLSTCGTSPSESSLFVAPHLIILKTCGTTLNLLGLEKILEIARVYCGLDRVWR